MRSISVDLAHLEIQEESKEDRVVWHIVKSVFAIPEKPPKKAIDVSSRLEKIS
jgi:hypothetical protein